MKMFLLVLIALLSSSCGPPPDPSITQDPELIPFINSFESEIGVDASHVSATFSKLTSPDIGMCDSYDDGRRDIYIDRDEWNQMDYVGREQLMYHELGHCAMNLEHNNSYVTLPGGTQVYGSIMNEYWFGDAWYYSQ